MREQEGSSEKKQKYRRADNLMFLRIPTCGVNANILSFREYNLLVLKIPTSLDLRPDKPNFLFRPTNNFNLNSAEKRCKSTEQHNIRI